MDLVAAIAVIAAVVFVLVALASYEHREAASGIACLALGVAFFASIPLVEAHQCKHKWADFQNRYTLYTGCMIKPASDRPWIPAENYRVVAD